MHIVKAFAVVFSLALAGIWRLIDMTSLLNLLGLFAVLAILTLFIAGVIGMLDGCKKMKHEQQFGKE